MQTAFKRFLKYDRTELEAAGKAFVSAAMKVVTSDLETALRTDFVLDWFSNARAVLAGTNRRLATVDARARVSPGKIGGIKPRVTYGEFLVDLAHTSYPAYEGLTYFRPKYYRNAIEQALPLKVYFALESELGKKGAPGEAFRKIMEDASKIAAVRADAKAMIFATDAGGQQQEEIFDALQVLRDKTEDTSPWLCIDLPWTGKQIEFKVY